MGLYEGLSQVKKLGEAPYLGSLVVLPSFPGEEEAHREDDSLSTLFACLLVGRLPLLPLMSFLLGFNSWHCVMTT